MVQRWIKATYYRGGTSKGVFFQKKDLPTSNQKELNDLFLKVIGSSPKLKQAEPFIYFFWFNKIFVLGA